MLQQLLDPPDLDLQVGEVIFDTSHILTYDEYEAIAAAHPDLRIEQRSTGELVILPPHALDSSDESAEILRQLRNWVKQKRLGRVLDSNALYFLPDGSKMSPDISFLSQAKWDALGPVRKAFPSLVPDFVVEVMSPSDRLRSAKAKMNDWIRNGVALGWLLDTGNRRAWIYTAEGVGESSLKENLPASGLLEGFVLEVADLDL